MGRLPGGDAPWELERPDDSEAERPANSWARKDGGSSRSIESGKEVMWFRTTPGLYKAIVAGEATPNRLLMLRDSCSSRLARRTITGMPAANSCPISWRQAGLFKLRASMKA